MDEISLYRKYRPHNFDNLVGQDHVKTTLVNALKSNHVSHAYLFTGPRGTGKTSTARLIAKALNCTNLDDGFEPCNECEFCVDINDGRLIDLIEIDAASNRGIDEVRDLKEKINFAPTRAKYKIYIVDEAHMMTKEAFNALLKTLEEPPAHAYFILATTEVHKIPETIISRCQRFDFKRISNKALMTRLSYIAQKEKIGAEDKALEVISKYVDGGLRDAIGLVEQLTVDNKLGFDHVLEILGVSDFSLLENLFNSLMQNETKEALNIIHELHGQGSDLKQFAHEFVDMLRNKMLQSVADDEPAMTALIIKMIELFQEAQYKLGANIPQLSLEIAVIQITGAFDDGPAEIQEETNTIPEESRKHKPLKAKPEPEKVNMVDLSLDSLRENWPRITERIKMPALRMCLRNGVPISLENFNITIEFSTNFDKDKVMEHDYRVELEETIKEIFGRTVKIATVVKAIEIKSVIEEQEDVENPVGAVDAGAVGAVAVGAGAVGAGAVDAGAVGAGAVGAVDQALEIFGGEVIE